MINQIKTSEADFRRDIIRMGAPWIGLLVLSILLVRLFSGNFSPIPGMISIFLSLVFISIPFLLKFRISVSFCAILLLFCINGIGLTIGLFNGGVRVPANVIFAIMPLAGFITAGVLGARVALVLSSLSLAILISGEHLKFIEVAEYSENFSNYTTLAIFTASIASYVTGSVYERTRKKSESKIVELMSAMQENARLASLGEMAGGVAHEINNPLFIIIGTAEKIKKMLKDTDTAKNQIDEELTKLISIALRAGKIANGLLAFSRDARNDPFHPTSVDSLVKGALNLCQEKFKAHGVTLEVSDFTDFQVECRDSQISQVILNLLNNSFDAIKGLPEKWIRLEIKNDRNLYLEASVTDSGNGIAPEIADKIMQPFFTTKQVGQGTGLGLSISRGIIASHRGNLTLDQKCKNTRFVFRIPLHHQN